MTWMSLLGGLISLAQLFMKARAQGQAARYTMAIEKINQLAKATDDEIAQAEKADTVTDIDPDAGRL